MSSQLPVPSKAALTALRGLVLGTSCTLALVVEDRRRRIKNALQVIENGERIKTAHNYRAGAEAVVEALQEEAMLERGGVSSWSKQQHQHPRSQRTATLITAPRRKSRLNSDDTLSPSHTGASSNTSPEVPVADAMTDERALPRSHVFEAVPRTQIPGLFIPPLSETMTILSPVGSWPVNRGEPAPPSRFAFPQVEEIISWIQEACTTQSPQKLNQALRLVTQVYEFDVAPGNDNRAWMKASAQLCRACQDAGQVLDASRILLRVVKRGPLEESDYFDHEPQRLVSSLLAECKEVSSYSKEAKQEAYAKFDAAVNLYLPTYPQKPESLPFDYADLGRRLLDWAFTFERSQRVEDIYWRCYLCQTMDRVELTEFFLEGLRKVHEPKLAIKIFRLNYMKLEPNPTSVARVGETVVQCVQDAHNYKAGLVLKGLLALCSNPTMSARFVATWAIRLLEALWKRHKDLAKVDNYFRELISSEVALSTGFLDGFYRIMIEIALEAGSFHSAESYFDELCAYLPQCATDIHVLGKFALAKARCGDWEGVRSDFEAIEIDATNRSLQDLSSVWVPVLKIYLEHHTISETEEFIRFYIDHMKVPPLRYVVTLVAKHYARIQDVQSFLGWLRYCTTAGFQIDSSFGNAILTNCAIHWGFSFGDLRKTYLVLKERYPDFVDRYTERFMANTALWLSKASNKPSSVRGRLASLGFRRDRYATRGKNADKHEIFLAMKEAIEVGRPARAIKIYKSAIHRGMPYEWHIFAQAVKAGLAISQRAAQSLIQDMRGKGVDVAGALDYVLIKKLRQVDRSIGKDHLLRVVGMILSEFEPLGLEVSATALDRAARLCLSVRGYKEAVDCALRAATIKGQLCHDVYNFTTLIQAYTALLDTVSVREVVAKALASRYKTDLLCLKALKKAKGWLRAAGNVLPINVYEELSDTISHAIDVVIEARRDLARMRHVIGQEVLSIMKQAALDKTAGDIRDEAEDDPVAKPYDALA